MPQILCGCTQWHFDRFAYSCSRRRMNLEDLPEVLQMLLTSLGEYQYVVQVADNGPIQERIEDPSDS